MNQTTTTAADMPLRLTLVEELLILRRRKGWSREQMAAKLKGDVTPRALRSWEEGSRTPHKRHEKRLREFIERESNR